MPTPSPTKVAPVLFRSGGPDALSRSAAQETRRKVDSLFCLYNMHVTRTPSYTNGTASSSDINASPAFGRTAVSAEQEAPTRNRKREHTDPFLDSLPKKTKMAPLAVTGYDHPHGPHWQATSAPCSGEPSSPEHGGITSADIQPYRDLERQYADLFATTAIQHVSSSSGLNLGRVKDVDMDECSVINASRGNSSSSIGTIGLATCIAVCARGKNGRNEDILALHHYSGIEEANDVMSDMTQKMSRHGVSNPEFYLVGGMILPEDEDAGSIDMERNLLSLRNSYNIRGAKLHLCIGEYDRQGEPNMTNVVLTPTQILFSRATLY
ncbi:MULTISPECIES: XopAK family type III secretion system effector [Ralstonia solanacearum species complex]|uniref:XopAK family type III secretion system effector n=1 Tax=Ralstonia solanacearum species complex TaxID=3116862 RepID=UPI001968F181|nr:XopAK family type III secretion system effector [Ralstonia solanacearum]BEU72822.1 hypothetical protein MAFF211271_23770 [Ralstonia pseudosolanacearum]